MKDRSLFVTCAEADFFDRGSQIDSLVSRAVDSGAGAPSLLLKGGRWVGKTEVLRRVHRRLFFDSAAVVPVYYKFRAGLSATDFAATFLKEVLTQVVAFNRRDSALVRTGLPAYKLKAMLADDTALAGAAGLLLRHDELVGTGDGREMVRNAFRVGAEVSGGGLLPLFFLFDDVDTLFDNCADSMPGAFTSFKSELKEAVSEFYTPVMATSGRGAFANPVWGGAPVESMVLAGLGEEDAVDMLANLCVRHNIEYDTDVLQQVARKVEGNPLYLRCIVWAASRRGLPLTTLKNYAALYAGTVIDGSIGALLKGALALDDKTALRLLYRSIVNRTAFGIEEVARELSVSKDEVVKSVTRLGNAGLLDITLGTYSWAGDAVMADFIRHSYTVAIGSRTAEEVKASFISEALRGGYVELGSGRAKAGVEDVKVLLNSFTEGDAPAVLFDNSTFVKRYNVESADISGNEEELRVIIPEIIGVFDTSGWESKEAGPPIIVARGFQLNRYDAGNEVVWLVFVKEGGTPVNQGDVDNFLRRAAILRHRFKGVRILRWVVGCNDFTPEAGERLDAEGVYSSDAMQLGILKEAMEQSASKAVEEDGAVAAQREVAAAGGVKRPRPEAGEPGAIKEFEVVLPRSSKAEMVAVKAVEEIGAEMGFDLDSIGQIKAALVEGCINAFEHSKSRSGRVFMRFVARADRLIIYIQNSGVGFDGKVEQRPPAMHSDGMPRKRGWGIELMKGLMDEVRFERLHDGTKIVLVKYLPTKVEE